MTTSDASPGILIGIARRAVSRGPMEIITRGHISLARGLEGDARGAKYPRRQITILAVEDWQAALADLTDLLSDPQSPPDLPWTTRRANLLTKGLRLPRAKGAQIKVGNVNLEVTGQTFPCHRMETARRGLLTALAPNWRGGVTCRVLAAGDVSEGDCVAILSSPREHVIRLPG